MVTAWVVTCSEDILYSSTSNTTLSQVNAKGATFRIIDTSAVVEVLDVPFNLGAVATLSLSLSAVSGCYLRSLSCLCRRSYDVRKYTTADAEQRILFLIPAVSGLEVTGDTLIPNRGTYLFLSCCLPR
jgi:hypothetical protein